MSNAVTDEQRRLLKTAFGPWLFKHNEERVPTYEEWVAAWDELFPPEPQR